MAIKRVRIDQAPRAARKPFQVRIIRDPRDATKDYWMDKDEARKAYLAGNLVFDVTNMEYAALNKG